VSRLGHGDPLHRLLWIARGWRAKPEPADNRRPPSPVRVIGHRGAPRVAAENTIASFRAALEAGAGAIETDICVTRDGRFLLWHDARPSETIAFARQTGRENLLYEPDVPRLFSRLRRPVSRLDFETFRLHYGYCRRREGLGTLFGNGDGPPEVPAATLEDLLEWAAREPRLRDVYLDVKLTGKQQKQAIELMERVESFAARAEAGHRPSFHYLSQHVEVLDALCRREQARGRGDVDLYGDFEKPGVLEFSRRLGLRNVSMGQGQRVWAGFRRELAAVIAARDRGRFDSVVVWTFNDPAELCELIAMGVDGILTDDSGLLRSLVPASETLEAAR
jgi:glycerophosphoryl diester phosphodiesterase